MSNVRVAPVMLPILLFILMIPLLIGVYVYRDASRRKMNAVLWTLIAVAAPSLIGFIIYLLVRGNHSDMECPKCQTTITDQYVVCPKCGAKLRPSCPNCSSPVDPDWTVCPKCATPLPEHQDDIVTPIRHKDKTLWKILAAVILAPVLLLVLGGLLFSVPGKSGSSSLREVSFDEYYSEQESQEISSAVKMWIDNLDLRSDQAYALRYDYSTDTGDEHFYLIYVPGAGEQSYSVFSQSGSFFGTTLSLELHHTGGSDSLFCILSSAENPPKLKITLNEKRIPCDVTVVDYNPTLFSAP